MRRSEQTTIKTSCPRDCYDSCGISAIVIDGKINRVLGDSDHEMTHGALCAKCAFVYNGVWIDPKKRLSHPLRRTGAKGTHSYQEVSWDEALTDISQRLHSIIEEYGGQSILHTHYTGICSLIAGNFPLRFFNRIGATEVDPDTVCNKAGHDTLSLMFGQSMNGFDPRTAKDTDCLIIWGANPSVSAPHVHKRWLPDVKQHAKVIVIDPIRHETADFADLHLQLRPGTDAVLAFALLHVLARNDDLDQTFITNSVLGWNQIIDEIDKTTPEVAAAITGVAVTDIETAAEWFGLGRSMLWLGQALQRQTHAGNIMRSASLLIAGTGNIGKPGSGFLYINGAEARQINLDWLSGAALNSSATQAISHMDLAVRLANSDKSKALFSWNNNIAASNPQQKALHQALSRDDLFHVAIDLFHTDTTAFADYILPASSFLEFDDVLLPYFHYDVSAINKVIEPIAESLPNQEIFRRLAAAMGFTDEALFESDQSLIEQIFQQLNMPVSFDELRKKGSMPWSEQPLIHYSDGVFPTASGKIDVASDNWLAAGLNKSPVASADQPPKTHYLRLLSPADPFLMNFSYGNDDKIAMKIGKASVSIHPQELADRQLVSGQKITLKNHYGELEVIVVASDRIPRGVALLPKGRWPSLEKTGANINILNDGAKTDIGQSSAVHSIEVELVS